MADLAQRVKHFSIALFGNRVTLAGITLCLAGFGGMYFNENKNPLYTVGNVSLVLGSTLLSGTLLGTETLRNYKRAKRHIQKNNGFDERYLRIALDTDATICNYCPSQGIYLAAKETGHVDTFEKARQQYSKMIILFELTSAITLG